MSDYFALLGLSPAFEVDLAQLETAYFREQRLSHPDRFIKKPEAQRLAAAQRSVDLNAAYKTLKEPLSRAQYLLKLQGIAVGSEKDSVKPSQTLLVEVMEWREAAEEGKDITAELKKHHQQSLQNIADAYKTQQWNAMAQETLRLGYIEKTLSELR